MAEAARAWDLGTLLAPIARRAPQTPYAVVMLNTPIPLGQKEAFLQLWKGAALRICADGASNRLLDTFGSTGTLDIPMPNLICGDLDSMRDDTRTFFEKQVGFVLTPSRCPSAASRRSMRPTCKRAFRQSKMPRHLTMQLPTSWSFWEG